MQPRRQFIGHALALGALSGAGLLPVFAQGRYPTKPVTLVVPFAPGGIADSVARTVSQAMGQSLGQTIVVDNRPGAGSIVAGQAVAKRLRQLGVRPQAGTPAQLQSLLASEIRRWREVIVAAKIEPA